VDFPLKMVIFHCNVSLPEGINISKPTNTRGQLMLSPTGQGDGSPRSDAARRSRLTATVAILLFTALVAGFFHFPYGPWAKKMG
jgi:hypothetical protein